MSAERDARAGNEASMEAVVQPASTVAAAMEAAIPPMKPGMKCRDETAETRQGEAANGVAK